jgi:hypothetical protein
MAGDNLNVWYDPEGDHLEIVFERKTGHFEDTSLENVMRKRDAEGNLLAISIFHLSSFAGTRSDPESTSGHDLCMTTDLSVTEVRALALALGLTPTDDDLPEVTHRLNAMRDALAPLSALPLDTAEPAPPTP